MNQERYGAVPKTFAPETITTSSQRIRTSELATLSAFGPEVYPVHGVATRFVDMATIDHETLLKTGKNFIWPAMSPIISDGKLVSRRATVCRIGIIRMFNPRDEQVYTAGFHYPPLLFSEYMTNLSEFLHGNEIQSLGGVVSGSFTGNSPKGEARFEPQDKEKMDRLGLVYMQPPIYSVVDLVAHITPEVSHVAFVYQNYTDFMNENI